MSSRWLVPVLLLALLAPFGCGGSEPPPAARAPAFIPKPDPCVTVRHNPSRGPGLFFSANTADGAGRFVSDLSFAPGATFAVVGDSWSVPEELPAVVTVVRSEPLADGTFTIHFAYGSTPSDPMALVGPIDPVESPLAGRIGGGLAPVAASIGVPQLTYQVTLPEALLFQKMVRCTEERYVEQIWIETESDAEGPTLVSSYSRKIAPPGPDLVQTLRETQQQHIFYVHGAIVREQGPEAISKEFGAYRFHDIVKALEETGATVHAALRPKDSSFQQGVQALTDEISALLASGVRPNDITIIGASEGGIMSLVAATNLANDQLSFVIMGACSPWAETNLKLNLHGRILSIYEKGDAFGGTCSAIARKSTRVSAYREIPLHTGLRHGFLYRPLPEWINPTLRWAQQLNVAPWGP